MRFVLATLWSDLTDLMYEPEAPVLWMHGHTHDAFDYVVGDTRVVCNPRGYLGEQRYYDSDRGAFKEDLLIEV